MADKELRRMEANRTTGDGCGTGDGIKTADGNVNVEDDDKGCTGSDGRCCCWCDSISAAGEGTFGLSLLE